MWKKRSVFYVLAFLLLFVTGCGAGAGSNETSEVAEILKDVKFGEKDYEQVVAAVNELGFKLVDGVEADQEGNTFISPMSLFMALSMVYNGADGVTKEEIAKALQVEGIDVNELNKANASMMSILDKETEEIQVDVANSIWLNEKYSFQDDFAEHNKGYFNAEIEEIDITSSESPKRINDWVKKATNDKIEEIVDSPLDSNLVAILINAIYFKGNWAYEFDEEETKTHPFKLEDGTTKDVPLMMLNEELAYMENEDFQAVALPYGEREMSMKVFLPRENINLDEFKKTITNDNWALWNSEFILKEGMVKLPKFQLEYDISLNNVLKELGMNSAFSEGADFTKMIKEEDPVWISGVKQKTFIDVNEEGTEAAAVTSVEMKTTSMQIDEPFKMEVNRPFFFTITDDETDAILFMGSIANPEQVE
ncbi:serpin family protein [Sporosarcina sp. G11-34]|uniref:serpin family protein n=1 Tax=Sporosarcina sp. G11-34 TaxID=2849605 RepID=UPI0022A94860|nr:serpin family protein [Sporosarcina sp. G11-34]MCZ2260314.1 serpin family protein [Sporosarcina sp. G11-34]